MTSIEHVIPAKQVLEFGFDLYINTRLIVCFGHQKTRKEPEFEHDGHTSRRGNGKSVRNGRRVR